MIASAVGERIRLRISPSEGEAFVRVDPGQIQQLVMNLCLNARDAMGRGGTINIAVGTQTFTSEDAAVRPWARPGTFVRLSVSDTGSGLSPDALDHVFEPFYTTKEKGTGMGLAAVYGIVQLYEGLVHIDSDPSNGTTCSVYLPADGSNVYENQDESQTNEIG